MCQQHFDRSTGLGILYRESYNKVLANMLSGFVSERVSSKFKKFHSIFVDLFYVFWNSKFKIPAMPFNEFYFMQHSSRTETHLRKDIFDDKWIVNSQWCNVHLSKRRGLQYMVFVLLKRNSIWQHNKIIISPPCASDTYLSLPFFLLILLQ